MKKKIIVSVGIVASLLIIAGLFVFATNKNSTQSINFENKGYKLESRTFKFNNKVYELKNVTAKDTGGYINDYLTDNETPDTYHTLISIDEYPNTDFSTITYNLYNKLSYIKNSYKDSKKSNVLLLSLIPINKNSTLIRYCMITSEPKNYVECGYYNVQKATDDNSSVVFLYTQRYFESDGILNGENYKQVIESDYAKIKPYITTVKAPDVVSKEKFSKLRSLEDIIKDQAK